MGIGIGNSKQKNQDPLEQTNELDICSNYEGVKDLELHIAERVSVGPKVSLCRIGKKTPKVAGRTLERCEFL
jgi:hypothetical protein